ncbi:MAG: hypothetical protein ACWA5A_10210 [Marinibacterium sp.]
MATVFFPNPVWDPANRHLVAATGEAILSNTGGHDVRWTRTPDDLPPALAPDMAALLRPGQTLVATVKAGERIWLTGDSGSTALIDPLG